MSMCVRKSTLKVRVCPSCEKYAKLQVGTQKYCKPDTRSCKVSKVHMVTQIILLQGCAGVLMHMGRGLSMEGSGGIHCSHMLLAV